MIMLINSLSTLSTEGMKSVKWTSKEPKKEGTTRTVNVNNMIINEYFLIWDENKRYAFRFDSIEKSSPFKAGLEDYILEEMPNGNTRFTYAVYLEPSFLLGLCSCIIKKKISKTFYEASVSFQNYINNNSYEAPSIISPMI
jgi:hypothetical protein